MTASWTFSLILTRFQLLLIRLPSSLLEDALIPSVFVWLINFERSIPLSVRIRSHSTIPPISLSTLDLTAGEGVSQTMLLSADDPSERDHLANPLFWSVRHLPRQTNTPEAPAWKAYKERDQNVTTP